RLSRPSRYLFPLSSPIVLYLFFFFSSRRRHTRSKRDWSSDVCSSDLSAFLMSRRWEWQAQLPQRSGPVVVRLRQQAGGFEPRLCGGLLTHRVSFRRWHGAATSGRV